MAVDRALVDARIAYHAKRLHTGMVGIVREYDGVKRVATVQPAIRRKLVDREWQDMQPLTGVPVFFPGGGGTAIIWDLMPGDPVTLHFSERDLAPWTGGTVGTYSPRSLRRHDINDAWCVPAGAPASVSLGREPGKLVIGLTNGTAKITIDTITGAVVVKGTTVSLDAPVVSLPTGAALGTYLTALHTALTSWVTVPNDGGAALKALITSLVATLTPPA